MGWRGGCRTLREEVRGCCPAWTEFRTGNVHSFCSRTGFDGLANLELQFYLIDTHAPYRAHTETNTYRDTHTHRHIYIQMYTHTRSHTHIYIYIYIYSCLCSCMYVVCVCSYRNILHTHSISHTYMHTYIYTYILFPSYTHISSYVSILCVNVRSFGTILAYI